ncbi:hypothetical protein ACOKM5_42910 [Streptomyces sp. BH097]|uniref:hypothetical protein n=1 Tax=unclassified Streptomyces TaxID=2593676 RepID=UPI003BB54CA0
MPEYDITWTIDVEADDPIEAARRALAVHPHHKPSSWATVVTVTDERDVHLVDLDPDGTGTEQATPTCTTRPRPAGEER